jgi:hypothetical protein
LATVQEKLAWLEAITVRVQQFVKEGGDLRSVEAAPLGMALFYALNDLTREFGVQAVRPYSASADPGPA